MQLHFKCGCGQYNYNREDWLSHFKFRGFWRGLRHLLLTEIKLKRDI